MLKPDLRDLPFTWQQDGVYWVERNVRKVPQRLFLLVGTHGQEIAGPLALKKLLEEEWRWPNVRMTACWQDPRGYDEEGYGFVSTEGEKSCWPPLAGYRKNKQLYWLFQDENSAWGMTVNIPPDHQTMRDLMARCDPTFCLTLHETVHSEVERGLFWVGADMILVETYPISPAEFAGTIDYLGDPINNPLKWTYRTLRDFFCGALSGTPLAILKYVWRRQSLKENPHYCLATSIVERYKELGGKVAGKQWMAYMDYSARDLIIGQGRLLHGVPFHVSEWRTATDYAVSTFGIPGITTETTPCAEIGLRGIEDRVFQQLTYIHAVLDVLNKRAGD